MVLLKFLVRTVCVASVTSLVGVFAAADKPKEARVSGSDTISPAKSTKKLPVSH